MSNDTEVDCVCYLLSVILFKDWSSGDGRSSVIVACILLYRKINVFWCIQTQSIDTEHMQGVDAVITSDAHAQHLLIWFGMSYYFFPLRVVEYHTSHTF